ncbi:hypothetical protein ANN_11229 [Periplaneta americana]|uniref:Uncharacterized protein n=1 Tax=Periplaneta americana TaxID=6978 RepID=A0ABQ8T4F8_PERAM|nr:hypothetical protein ANN_11229 [Periplaneta americana]
MRILRKASPKSRKIAYLTLVRPLMEYGTTCWDPYRIYQINSLERIQYRAAKFVKGKREDGNDTIKELKWETLENRRRKTRIASLYRPHLGQKAWVDITARLEKPTYYSRNDHDFKIKCRKQKTDVERIPNLTGEQSDGITVFRIPPMTSLMLHRGRTGAINLQRWWQSPSAAISESDWFLYRAGISRRITSCTVVSWRGGKLVFYTEQSEYEYLLEMNKTKCNSRSLCSLHLSLESRLVILVRFEPRSSLTEIAFGRRGKIS